ncbi:hypothetical protein [Burkholderia pyrrocinia]|uniref:hypothetical protein n=1 Tax=Burkholderia pyrrocinia TaxID=60550 RepID=UPI001FC8890B|nr:hypothetical protein [Burkholderia pyrrocinia]
MLFRLPCAFTSVPAVIVAAPPDSASPASVALPLVAVSVLLPTAVVAPTDRFWPAAALRLLPVWIAPEIATLLPALSVVSFATLIAPVPLMSRPAVTLALPVLLTARPPFRFASRAAAIVVVWPLWIVPATVASCPALILTVPGVDTAPAIATLPALDPIDALPPL